MDNKPDNDKLNKAVVFLANLVQQECGKRRLGSADLPQLHKSLAKFISDIVAITKGISERDGHLFTKHQAITLRRGIMIQTSPLGYMSPALMEP